MVAVMVPFIGIIALLVDATILHIIYRALGGKGTYEGTAKLVLYSSATSLFFSVPLVGWIFGICQFYLYISGGKFLHDISMEKSLLEMFLFLLLIMVFVVLLTLSGLAPNWLTTF
ncbi:MAG TPA: YIP1 family protein [Methanobacterium sp.]|nr:YIP1 family protein [Methanobacterium sp.]